MKKIIHPYDIIQVYSDGRKRKHPAFVKIEYEDGKLSLSGVVDPNHYGNAWGGAGQIDMDFKENHIHGHLTVNDVHPNLPKWNRAMIRKLLAIWKDWHLNDMRSACEHQRALGWTYEEHHGMFVEKPRKVIIIDEYDDGTDNDYELVWNEYKGHECPTCGYSIGSQWLFEEVPQDVIDWLFSLPETDKTPAWI